MSGNVWEVLQDWFDVYPSTPQTDPTGPASGTFKVFRGGAIGSELSQCRSAYRDGWPLDGRNYSIGFRLAGSQ